MAKGHLNMRVKNEDVVLKSRSVQIDLFDLYHIDLPNIDFSVTCSKGTYIRSLVHDFGKSLNNGAYLTDLRQNSHWKIYSFKCLYTG